MGMNFLGATFVACFGCHLYGLPGCPPLSRPLRSHTFGDKVFFWGYVVYGRRRLKTDLIDKQGYVKLNGCI